MFLKSILATSALLLSVNCFASTDAKTVSDLPLSFTISSEYMLKVANSDALGEDNTKLKKASAYNIGVASAITDNFDIGIEFGKREEKDKKEDQSSISLLGDLNKKLSTYMLKAHYTFSPEDFISPYVDAGIGISKLSIKSTGLGEIDNEFKTSYSLGAGVSVKATENVIFGVGAKYFATLPVDYDSLNSNIKSTADNVDADIKTGETAIEAFLTFKL